MKPRTFLIDIVLLSFLFALVVKVFFFQTYRVESLSMDPTLKPNDRLLCIKPVLFHGLRRDSLTGRIRLKKRIRRGSIVVFTPPIPPATEYVKRVVGLPGETLLMNADLTTIDGAPLYEPWAVFDGLPSFPGTVTVTLRTDEFFLAGDNRNHSADSRSFGPVPEENIEALCIAVYWPPDRFHIFR